MNNKDSVNDTMQKAADHTKEAARDVGSEIVRSSKDWLGYIQSHPLQSVLFGIIGYFALKGIVKD